MNNNLRSAFIVKDPKTYVSAEEAWYEYARKKEGSFLFIIIPKGDPNNVVNTLNSVIDKNKWEEIIWIKTLSNYNPPEVKLKKKSNYVYGKVLKYREYVYNKIDKIKIDKIAKKYQPCQKVFSGHKNTQEHLAASLNPDDLSLMDSGMVLGKINKSGYIDYSRSYQRSRLRKFIFKLIGFKVFDRNETKLFTVYADIADTKHKLIKNEQNYKRDLIRGKKVDDYAILISSPIYKMTKGVKLASYIQYLKTVISVLKIDSSKLIYIPNPIKETDEDISEIEKSIGCKIDSRLIPVEMKIANYDTIPSLCISPCSTALVNIAVISENIIRNCIVWHPEFDYFEFLVDWKNDAMNNTDAKIEFLQIDESDKMFHIDESLFNNKPIFNDFKEWYIKTGK